MLTASLLLHPQPVSYTHLDVYKRQPTDWLFGTVRVLLTIQSKVGDLRRLQVVKALVKKQRAGSFWACLLYTSRCV